MVVDNKSIRNPRNVKNIVGRIYFDWSKFRVGKSNMGWCSNGVVIVGAQKIGHGQLEHSINMTAII